MTEVDPSDVVFSEEDERFMALALEDGARGNPSPNPHVGAILVKDGQVVGRGHHERAGEHHAEIVALRQSGKRAAGATLYVTLEPCNHVGRTPPCTDALVAANVARVVVGCFDPNPHVTGGGVARLRSAGVRVDVGCREAEARRMIAPWAKFVTTGIPYVALKLALSLDGRIASRTGASEMGHRTRGPRSRSLVARAARRRHRRHRHGAGGRPSPHGPRRTRPQSASRRVRHAPARAARVAPGADGARGAHVGSLHDGCAILQRGPVGRARGRGAPSAPFGGRSHRTDRGAAPARIPGHRERHDRGRSGAGRKSPGRRSHR